MGILVDICDGVSKRVETGLIFVRIGWSEHSSDPMVTGRVSRRLSEPRRGVRHYAQQHGHQPDYFDPIKQTFHLFSPPCPYNHYPS